jgi:hypothetical protein
MHFFDKCGGRLSAELVGSVGIFLGRLPFWSGASRLQASLVEEGQDGVLLQNTWCSGTSCGGINSYTLMALHGRSVRISELLGELCGASREYLMVKET